MEFLPAALEVQQRPPSPLGRVIIWSLICMFVAALAWAVLGSTDIVAIAPGRIVSSGHNKLIQPLEMGRIGALYVSEGQRVVEGELLLELDDESLRADQQNLLQELSSLKWEYARLSLLQSRLLGEQIPDGNNENVAGLPLLQQQLLASQWHEYQANQEALYAEHRKREAEQATVQQQINKLEAVLPLLAKRTDALRKLTQQKFHGENSYLELEQERVEMVHDLTTLRQRMKETVAAIAEIDAQRDQAKRALLSRVLLEQQQNRKRVESLRQQQIKAGTRLRAHSLHAPISGVVQQLAVHTLGGVVTPAQQLMLIVPDEAVLEVEALVENRDIGFLREGQRVEVKIDAFPFTRYGVIDAVLTDLSNDAITDEARGLVYKARIALQQSRILVEQKWVNLSPGMSVTAEVKTGTRRLIEFFLSPLLRYRQESIRER